MLPSLETNPDAGCVLTAIVAAEKIPVQAESCKNQHLNSGVQAKALGFPTSRYSGPHRGFSGDVPAVISNELNRTIMKSVGFSEQKYLKNEENRNKLRSRPWFSFVV
jgi:hypothetical protein